MNSSLKPFTLWLSPDTWPPAPNRGQGPGFTLWLDPAHWPRPAAIADPAPVAVAAPVSPAPVPVAAFPAALKALGNGHTLWLSPDAWPRPKLRILSSAHTVWLDPARWPQPSLRLPGNAMTLWLDPATWPVVKAPEPIVVPEVLPTALASPLPISGATPGPALPVEKHEAPPAASPVHPTSPPTSLSTVPAMTTPIRISVNQGHTLWTTNEALAAMPSARTAASAAAATTGSTAAAAVKKPALKLPGKAFTLWASPQRVERITMSNHAAPVTAMTGPTTPAAIAAAASGASCCAPSGRSWLPLAAGLAIAALLGLLWRSAAGERDEAVKVKADLTEKLKAGENDKAAREESLKQLQIAKDSEVKAAKAKFDAQAAGLTGELNKSKDEAAKKTTAGEQMALELAKLKTELAAKAKALQEEAGKAVEELNKIKKSSAEEIAKTAEKINELEAAKAAAAKEAAAAAAEAATLKAEVDKLRKQLESGTKPAGTPSA